MLLAKSVLASRTEERRHVRREGLGRVTTAAKWLLHLGRYAGNPSPATASSGRAGERALQGTASLWRTAGWRQLGAPLTQRGLVLDVQFSPDGDLVATSSTDSTLALWDVRTRRQIGTPLPAPWTGPTCEFWRNEHWSTVRFSPDDKRLFAVYDNGRAVR